MNGHSVFIPGALDLNRYLTELYRGIISSGTQAVVAPSLDLLEDCDATWIQWPETLVNRQRPSNDRLKKVEQWLQKARDQGPVAWTVHNLLPHNQHHCPQFRQLYSLVSEYADIHFHLGHTSVKLLSQTFPEANPSVVEVLPHGGYWPLLGQHSQEAARKELGIATSNRILLVFGAVRSMEEYELVIQAGRTKGWTVLLAGRRPSLRSWNPLKTVRNYGRVFLPRALADILEYPGIIEEDKVDVYCKAADALLIPKLEGLNSGNLYLGFTFGLPVIGPDIGNIGEHLKSTSNSVYDPMHPTSLTERLEKWQSADLAVTGQNNADWISQHGQWKDIAQQALDLVFGPTGFGSTPPSKDYRVSN